MLNFQSNTLSEAQFKHLLEYECKRARRYQFFFSLLVLKSETPDSELPLLTEVPALIRRVIRDGDPVGVVHYNKLAILLYFADNPAVIAKRVVKKLHCEIPGVKMKVGEACFPVNATTAEDLFHECLQRVL